MLRVTELAEETDGAEEPRRMQLENRLREVNERLRRELRARGFDPDQDDNLALTAPLAKLYTERENLRVELESYAALSRRPNRDIEESNREGEKHERTSE